MGNVWILYFISLYFNCSFILMQQVNSVQQMYLGII